MDNKNKNGKGKEKCARALVFVAFALCFFLSTSRTDRRPVTRVCAGPIITFYYHGGDTHAHSSLWLIYRIHRIHRIHVHKRRDATPCNVIAFAEERGTSVRLAIGELSHVSICFSTGTEDVLPPDDLTTFRYQETWSKVRMEVGFGIMRVNLAPWSGRVERLT